MHTEWGAHWAKQSPSTHDSLAWYWWASKRLGVMRAAWSSTGGVGSVAEVSFLTCAAAHKLHQAAVKELEHDRVFGMPWSLLPVSCWAYGTHWRMRWWHGLHTPCGPTPIALGSVGGRVSGGVSECCMGTLLCWALGLDRLHLCHDPGTGDRRQITAMCGCG